MTTKAILDGEAKIGFICRTEPLEQTDSNGYHDTGWQILSGDETDAYFENADNGQFVALGVLLNMDDSFIHLLDSEVGSAFVKNEQGDWVVDETFELEDEQTFKENLRKYDKSNPKTFNPFRPCHRDSRYRLPVAV